MNSETLGFIEYSSYVNHILTSLGYQKATTPNEADLVIFLQYGIGDPKEREISIPIPVYGQTGTSSSTSFKYGNYTTTIYTPRYGITDYQTYTEKYLLYLHYLVLTGYNLNPSQKDENDVKVWQTYASCVSDSGDLREVSPIIVSAVIDYIGKNTGQFIEITLYEDDVQVNELRHLQKDNIDVEPEVDKELTAEEAADLGMSEEDYRWLTFQE